MAKNDDDEPVWRTVIKLIVVATVILGGTWLMLSYFGGQQSDPLARDPAHSGKSDWGIVNDSPIKRLR